MKLATFTFKLRPETTLGQIWEATREWIEGSPYSRFKGRRILPTKIAEGEAHWEVRDDCVSLCRAGEAMRVRTTRTRRGLGWQTTLGFMRIDKFVKGVVEMRISGSIPEGDIELKEPIIVKRLVKTYGFPEVKSKKEEGKSKVGKPKVKRGARVERIDNVAALTKVLRTHAFEMLGMPGKDRIKLMRATNGRSLADEAGVRQASVGKCINLKWRKQRKPAETLLQLLYIICTDDNTFRFFEEAAKDSRAIWEKKSDEELYALIKAAFRPVASRSNMI